MRQDKIKNIHILEVIQEIKAQDSLMSLIVCLQSRILKLFLKDICLILKIIEINLSNYELLMKIIIIVQANSKILLTKIISNWLSIKIMHITKIMQRVVLIITIIKTNKIIQ
jgi:hypothetical protein